MSFVQKHIAMNSLIRLGRALNIREEKRMCAEDIPHMHMIPPKARGTIGRRTHG